MIDEQPATMTQTAPYPTVLAALVEKLSYRPGWRFELSHMKRDDDHGRGEAGGLTLDIVTLGYNSYHPEHGETYSVHHYRIVPAATYNEQSWQRWLFDQCVTVDLHEAMEFFAIDDEHPYAPLHGPGNDPYVVRELTSDEQRRTSFRGVVKS